MLFIYDWAQHHYSNNAIFQTKMPRRKQHGTNMVCQLAHWPNPLCIPLVCRANFEEYYIYGIPLGSILGLWHTPRIRYWLCFSLLFTSITEGSTGVNHSYDENFFIFLCGYIIILFTQLAHKKLYVTRQIKKIWVSVWNEVWLDLCLLTHILRKWRESIKLIILLGLPYLFSLI